MEEEAAKTGNQAGGGLWKGAKWVDDASNYANHQWYKVPGWYESTSSAEAHLLPEATQARLNARKVKHETAPAGFFEGIPGIGELTGAIGALTAAIPNIPRAGEAWDKASGSEPAAKPEVSIPKSYTNGQETISPKAWGTLDSDQKEHWTPQYAVGATFNKGGLFTGQVHEKEEIIPQAIAQKGTGPLSKVLGDLQQSGQGPSGRSVNIHVDEQLRVEVINPVVPDTGAAYQLTDILKRQLDPFIEETVKRKVAQYIT